MADTSDPRSVAAVLIGGIASVRAEYALEITANLREACPVDTGHARANIIPSKGSPFAGVDLSGTGYEQGVLSVLGAGPDDELFVVNNVPYWGKLIGGSSSQAPAGWDLVAIDKATSTMQERYGSTDIDVSSPSGMADRGGYAAGNLAAAFSPFED